MPAYRVPIVGSQFHKGANEAIARLAEGDTVNLVKEPTNQYDPYAVRVENNDGQMLGFVPADLSRLTTDLIDSDRATPAGRVFLEKRGVKVAIDYNLTNGGMSN